MTLANGWPLDVLVGLAQNDEPTGGGLIGLLPILLIFVVFYFLLIRPQQKRQREHRQLVASLEPGNRVVTIGGVHGTVRRVDDDERLVEVDVGGGTVLTLDRSAIGRRVDPDDAGDGEDD